MDHFLDSPTLLEMWTSLEVPYCEKGIQQNQALDLDYKTSCVKAGNHDVEEESQKEHWKVVETKVFGFQVDSCVDSTHLLF
jgi:hypothetical protein